MAAIIGGGTDGLRISFTEVLEIDKYLGQLPQLKSMDANRYATKKTIAQGMLDIALLTANASQLKYILQVGQKHEFYTLMLTLISISICLQLIVGILFIVIGSLNINRHKDQNAAVILNDVSAAIIAVVLITLNGESHQKTAAVLNHIAMGFVLGAMFCDVVKMNFGLDPAIPIPSQTPPDFTT
uniref:Uncharacterized protein n=1 Tax=Lutzomyia longipalpis TaxID=7200 RepID=A0A1B0GJW6_LUTLO